MCPQEQTGHFPGEKNTLDHKLSLHIFKKIGIIQSIFSNHNRMELEINDSNWKINKIVEILTTHS